MYKGGQSRFTVVMQTMIIQNKSCIPCTPFCPPCVFRTNPIHNATGNQLKKKKGSVFVPSWNDILLNKKGQDAELVCSHSATCNGNASVFLSLPPQRLGCLRCGTVSSTHLQIDAPNELLLWLASMMSKTRVHYYHH